MLPALLAAGLFAVAPVAFAGSTEYLYQRVAKEGENHRYDLERRIYGNDSPIYVATAVSSHTVVGASEVVGLESYAKFSGRQPIDQSKEIAGFGGFTVPLAEDPVKPPAFSGVESTLAGLLRDLHSLLANLGPRAQLGRLKKIGDSYSRQGEGGDWRSATGSGSTCGRLTTQLVDLSLNKAVVKVSYLAPETACLKMKKPWMEAAQGAGAAPNNIQQVMRIGRSHRVQWGRQQYIIDAVLDRKTGLILSAQLEDIRLVMERTGCDDQLEHCSPASPANLRRILKLKIR